MKNEIIIVGAFHEIIELAEENDYKIIGLIDNTKTDSYRNYIVFCNDSSAPKLNHKLKQIPLVISPDMPNLRMELEGFYKKNKFLFTSIISKRATISGSAKIALGTVVQSGVNISAEVEVGKFVKLNTMCNLMHNSVVGNYTTIAPNTVILGNVKIGKLCYIGANATILPNVQIVDKVVIGAGTVVTKNILKSGSYIGNPARELLK